MTTQMLFILVLIGLVAGILSGFVGVGGGIVIVPALIYILGFTQYQAQGTSLFVLSMPVVILATLNYWKAGNVNWKFGLIIATTFVVGGYIGSKLALKISPGLVKFIFGLVMAYVSFRLILAGYQSLSSNES
ncbi:MAG: sulfite exporter TauE/SafE family protein [Bacteroidetes bacterium]|nr:sulfite exporter TauE/SafE family protein [Bacteroidota bacterium]